MTNGCTLLLLEIPLPDEASIRTQFGCVEDRIESFTTLFMPTPNREGRKQLLQTLKKALGEKEEKRENSIEKKTPIDVPHHETKLEIMLQKLNPSIHEDCYDPETQTLNLSMKGLSAFPRSFFQSFVEHFPVKHLILSHNNIRKFPNLKKMTGLRTLDLSHNYITKIDQQIDVKCPNLEILLLQDNELTSLPKSLEMLLCLEEINLSFNHLQRFPDFHTLFNLKTLDITYNPKDLWRKIEDRAEGRYR
ncbi:TPA: hypothetical protein DD799_04790 [Candidatus Dependentiae bacterium]|nr:hypothetical protein [Candidatus Dependentiae bacterium]